MALLATLMMHVMATQVCVYRQPTITTAAQSLIDSTASPVWIIFHIFYVYWHLSHSQIEFQGLKDNTPPLCHIYYNPHAQKTKGNVQQPTGKVYQENY